MSTIARFPLFADAGVDMSAFDRRCVWKKYVANEIVVDFQDASRDVYLILAGEARALIRTAAGKEVILADLRAGDVFGELAAIDEAPRSANVTALSRCEVCIVPAAAFRELVFVSPTVCDRVLRLLTGRIRELDARFAEHQVLDLKHRLYAEILRLSHPRAGRPGERVITPPPYHHVLAARVGCRREQITREFSAMEKEGLVARGRGGLVILQPEAMEARLAQALDDDA